MKSVMARNINDNANSDNTINSDRVQSDVQFYPDKNLPEIIIPI